METFPESTSQPITTNQQQQNTHWPCPKCRFIDYSMVGAGVHFFPLFLCALCYRWHSWAFVGMCVCMILKRIHYVIFHGTLFASFSITLYLNDVFHSFLDR